MVDLFGKLVKVNVPFQWMQREGMGSAVVMELNFWEAHTHMIFLQTCPYFEPWNHVKPFQKIIKKSSWILFVRDCPLFRGSMKAGSMFVGGVTQMKCRRFLSEWTSLRSPSRIWLSSSSHEGFNRHNQDYEPFLVQGWPLPVITGGITWYNHYKQSYFTSQLPISPIGSGPTDSRESL